MKHLTLKRAESLAFVEIERPPANALSGEVIEELDALLSQIEQDLRVRTILIYGKGKFFSAGADIKEFAGVEDADKFFRLGQRGQEVFSRIENFRIPVIAAIHGAALGGGLELAMACHIRYVSNEAKLGLPELKLGLVPGFGGTQRLPGLVGASKAAEMIMTGEPITGMEAVSCGLASKCFPEDDLLREAEEVAHSIAEKSPESLKAVIELLQFEKSSRIEQGLSHERRLFGELFNSENGHEGIKAFMEKREPVFKREKG